MAVARVEMFWDPSVPERGSIVAAVADALVTALRVPPGDPTVVATTHTADGVLLPTKVSDRYTIVTVTMFAGRSRETKVSLYREVVERLGRCGVPPAEVLIVLDEVPAENWGVDGGVPATETEVGFKIDI